MTDDRALIQELQALVTVADAMNLPTLPVAAIRELAYRNEQPAVVVQMDERRTQ